MTITTTTFPDVDATDRSALVPLPEFDPYWTAADDLGGDAFAEPGTGVPLTLAVDRIERHYTKRPAMDDVGVFGSGPRSGRAPTSFDVFGPGTTAEGLPTTVVLDGLRWAGPESDDWA